MNMTDAELEIACKRQLTELSPSAYWTSEVYSIGKCLRFWTKYPAFLPLFVYSDHGVTLSSDLEPHELENAAGVHFTWHPLKVQKYRSLVNKKVLLIPHPWTSYRRLRGIKRATNPSGTLAFFTHHGPDWKWEGHDTDDYFSKLRDLPEKFQPVVLCLHMHDIHAGHHKNLRRHGFPIVTAGNAHSPNFVDKFYDLLKNFSYTTSSIWGSQIAYSIELGVPHFFLGNPPTLVNISSKEIPLSGEMYGDVEKDYQERLNTLFALPVDIVTTKQREIVESLLGKDSQLTAQHVSHILWLEFFRHWLRWNIALKCLLVYIFHKLKLSNLVSSASSNSKCNSD